MHARMIVKLCLCTDEGGAICSGTTWLHRYPSLRAEDSVLGLAVDAETDFFPFFIG